MMQMVAAMICLELDLGQRTVMMHQVAAMMLDSGHWTLEPLSPWLSSDSGR